MKVISIGPNLTLGKCKRGYSKRISNKNSEQQLVNDVEMKQNSSQIIFCGKGVSRVETVSRLCTLGVAGIDTKRFDKVLSYFKTSNGYSDKLLKVFETIADKLDENKIERKGVMTALMTEFMPNVEMFNFALDEMLKRGIQAPYITTIFEFAKNNDSALSEIDYNIVAKLLRCRDLAMENKEKLEHKGRVVSQLDIDSLCFELPHMMVNMYDLLGEKAFVYSFKDKMDNVIDYMVALGRPFENKELKNKLMLLTNPTATDDMIFLNEDISALKLEYKTCLDFEVQEKIAKRISTLTRKKNDILENSIKDPKVILDTALIITALQSNNLETEDILQKANPQTEKQKSEFNRLLNKKIIPIMGGENVAPNLLKRLDFSECKYIARLFAVSGEFKRQFKKMLTLLASNPQKTNLQIFNEIEQNIKTRNEFEQNSLDYDYWVASDDIPVCDVKDAEGNDTGIKVRKVDMNDIPHALTLGQDADCCTKLGGKFDFSSVGYIKNKMISAIEVLDGDVCVGNTMCYFAKVKGKVALVLDNLAFKPRYRYNKDIENGIYDYAKQLANEVAKRDIPVYVAGARNQVKPNEQQKADPLPLQIIGNTGNDFILFDFMSTTMCMGDDKQTWYANLVKVA